MGKFLFFFRNALRNVRGQYDLEWLWARVPGDVLYFSDLLPYLCPDSRRFMSQTDAKWPKAIRKINNNKKMLEHLIKYQTEETME